MKRGVFIIFFSGLLMPTLSQARPVCVLLKGSRGEIPANVDRLVLSGDPGRVRGEFKMLGYDARGREIADGLYQCVSSTPEKTRCQADDDAGIFTVDWSSSGARVTSMYFALADLRGREVRVEAPPRPPAQGNRRANPDDEMPEEFVLTGEKIPCPKQRAAKDR